MKVTIIELDYHAEVLQNFLALLKPLPVEVEVVTIKRVWERVVVDDFRGKVHVLEAAREVRRLFRAREAIYQEADVVVFNTLNAECRFFNSLRFASPVVARVHNSNTFFLPLSKSYHPKWSAFYLWKDFSHFVRKTIFELDAHYRGRFLKKVNFFSFISEEMIDYALANNFLDEERILQPPIPSGYYQGGSQASPARQEVHLSIIGGVDQRRRDYQLVVEALPRVLDQTDTPIHLHLLGKATGGYARDIVQKFRALEGDKFTLSYYENFVPQEVFDETVAKTSFLLSPIYERTRHTVYSEYYGKTKISGSVNDMIKYGVPSILPAFYPVPRALTFATEQFELTSEDLARAMIKCVNTPHLSSSKNHEKWNHFAYERMAEKLMEGLTFAQKNAKK
jgi:hypothetical protein